MVRAFLLSLATQDKSDYLLRMKKTIYFTKMSGAGNDFVVIDNMDEPLQVDKSKLAIALCSRYFGVGADGLLLLEPSSKADFFMRYYNADGSYGGMCGNGGRCIARYAYVNGIAGENVNFEALDYLYTAEISSTSVKLEMKNPNDFRFNLLVAAARGEFRGHFTNTGSPHFVIELSDLDTVDVHGVGKEIRFHPLFAPDGCNVDFITVTSDNRLLIRTYERGVEAETLACGTGSVASAIIAAHSKGMKSPVTLKVRSGEELHVHFSFDGTRFTNVFLEGSAHMLFSGDLLYDTERCKILDSSHITTHATVHA